MNVNPKTQSIDIKHGTTVRMLAGGTGDNTATTSDAIDTLNSNAGIFTIMGTATLGEDDTLTLKSVKVTQSDTSGGSYTDAIELIDSSGSVVATGGTGGSTETGSYSARVDLSLYKRYVKLVYTPDLSRANTDVGTLSSALILDNITAPVTLATTF